MTQECGLYVDIVFDVLELAARRDSYVELYDDLRARGDELQEEDDNSWLTIIRVEPGQVGFHELNVAAWKVAAWVYGAGTSVEMAAGYRNRGLIELANCLERASSELAKRGSGGTPLVSQLSP